VLPLSYAGHATDKICEIEFLIAVHVSRRAGALAFDNTDARPGSLVSWTASDAVFTAPEDIKPVLRLLGTMIKWKISPET